MMNEQHAVNEGNRLAALLSAEVPQAPAAPAPVAVSNDELSAFAQGLRNNIVAHHAEHFPNLIAPEVEVQRGPKFARIVVFEKDLSDPRGIRRVHQSVHCFIRLEDGAILRAASWKAPAKHARGNIRVGDAGNWWKDAVNAYGAAYLR